MYRGILSFFVSICLLLSSFSSPLLTFLLLLCLRALLWGCCWRESKRTQCEMNTALTSQTPPTQPIRSLLPNTQGTIIGWCVGNMTTGDLEWREKGREWEEEGGRDREWCYGSSMHFNRPFAQDRKSPEQNLAVISSEQSRSQLTAKLTDTWGRWFVVIWSRLTSQTSLVSEAKECALNPQTGNDCECRSFPWDGASAVANRGSATLHV